MFCNNSPIVYMKTIFPFCFFKSFASQLSKKWIKLKKIILLFTVVRNNFYTFCVVVYV